MRKSVACSISFHCMGSDTMVANNSAGVKRRCTEKVGRLNPLTCWFQK